MTKDPICSPHQTRKPNPHTAYKVVVGSTGQYCTIIPGVIVWGGVMHGNSYNQGSPLLLGGTDFFNFFFFVILDAESERCRCAREGLSRL